MQIRDSDENEKKMAFVLSLVNNGLLFFIFFFGTFVIRVALNEPFFPYKRYILNATIHVKIIINFYF